MQKLGQRPGRKLGVWLLAGIPALAFAGSSVAQPPQETVDVELVLAADVSQSLDYDEQLLQRRSYVAAFQSGDVIDAMTSGPHKRIAVAYMEFAGDSAQKQTIPWTIIDGEASARAFADRLAAQPIRGEQHTSISAALYEAARWIDGNGIASARQVINVSSDGANAAGPPLETARDDLLKRGFVINGFPLMLDKPREYYDIDQLDRYFERCLAGGGGAFVAPLKTIDQMSSALRRTIMPAATPSAQTPAAPVDCMAGEKAMAAGPPSKNRSPQ